jgi:ATP synthase protein I
MRRVRRAAPPHPRQVTMMVDHEPAETQPRRRKPVRARGPIEDNAGWSVFSYLIAGMLFYGAGGWLLSRVTHIAILFPVGMLVGLVLALVLIIFRYGRP